MIEATKNLNNIKKVQNKKENMAKDSDDAVLHFEIWVGAGMKVDTYTGMVIGDFAGLIYSLLVLTD